ncbi:hypothetical protein AX17_004245 [Amanita inopinata Kibby_2008]|nr:hypothetical protein AX17_004245 [Amanita inopinata Kibby_2008]
MSKKAPKAPKEVSSYETRDVVLGKVRGYPPWPGMVVDPESVPPSVAKERPTNKKATFYCVRFFPTGDYAWLVAKDISKLQAHEIESYINEPYKKSGDLLQGYRIALDPTKWEQEIEAARREVVEEEHSTEIDELESENEDEDAAKAKSRKRKRMSDAAAASKSKKALTKSKRNGTKSRAMVESEDEGDTGEAGVAEGAVKPSKKASSPPPTKKARRGGGEEYDEAQLNDDPEALRVREWRHKLQKYFLSNKGLPTDQDMPSLNVLFSTVENYDKINIQYLSFSKIGKVMRHIAVLPAEKVPRDDEFKFRERAKALVDKWHQILNANKPNGAEAGAVTANGTGAKTDEGQKKAEQTKEVTQEATKEQEKEQENENEDENETKEEDACQLSASKAVAEPMDMDMTDTNEIASKDAPSSSAPVQDAGSGAAPDVTMSEA